MAKLTGVREIQNYLNLSEATVMDMIFKQGLPAERNKQGEWVADSKKVDLWLSGGKKSKKKTASKSKQPDVGAAAKAKGSGRDRRVKPDNN